MKFSMAKMLLVMGFVSVVLAAVFAMPASVGFIVLLVVSLLFLPQFLWVGAINTRGRTQAFFIGAILSGIPHFCICTYYMYAIGIYMNDIFDSSSDEAFLLNVVHLIGYAIGIIGGLGGVFAHWFIVPKAANVATERPKRSATEPGKPPRSDEFSHPLGEDPVVPNLPK